MYNKTLIISIITVVSVSIVLAVSFMFLRSSPQEEQTPLSPGVSYPGYSAEVTPGGPVGGGASTTPVSGTTFALPITGGRTLTIRDFRKDGDVFIDNANNPGFYALGPLQDDDANTPDPSYLVGYQEPEGFFIISLLQEPLGESRIQAEAYLMTKLGADQSVLCALNYSVNTLWWVSEIYAGKNLGFSFCPGATPL